MDSIQWGLSKPEFHVKARLQVSQLLNSDVETQQTLHEEQIVFGEKTEIKTEKEEKPNKMSK